MLKALQWPLACALVVLIAYGVGFLSGRLTAHRSAALRSAEDRIEGIEQREGMTHEIEALDDDAFRRDLYRWLSRPGG